MSNFIQDLGSLVATTGNRTVTHNTNKTSPDLDMTDFLQLMVVQLQSQTIDNTADTSDMLNQLVQMQMVTALTNMTEASLMSYAGSMVGKEVTIGDYSSGQLVERVVTITGTGVSGGEQVLFAGDETFSLSNVMAIGRLPAIEPEDGAGSGNPSGGNQVEKPVEPESGGTGESTDTSAIENSGAAGENADNTPSETEDGGDDDSGGAVEPVASVG